MAVRFRAAAVTVALSVIGPVGLATPKEVAADGASCSGSHWVGSWAASPSDALVPVDATGASVPTSLLHQTLRMVVSPHLGGSTVRVRLSNASAPRRSPSGRPPSPSQPVRTPSAIQRT